MQPALPGLNHPVAQTVLVLEADPTVLDRRASFLQESAYTVTTARSLREIGSQPELSIAILSLSFGAAALRDTAAFIRRSWPRARILVVGDVQLALDDNLYDDAIHHLSRKEELLKALTKLSGVPAPGR